MSLLEIHSPHCEAPTGRVGTVTTHCGHGAIVRDASICGATKPCPIHGGEFPTEEDVPIELRRELLKAATDKQISYYWLCALYRKGKQDTAAGSSRERAEALWEELGGDLCICQRPDVPHWCETCQRRIDTIQAAFSMFHAVGSSAPPDSTHCCAKFPFCDHPFTNQTCAAYRAVVLAGSSAPPQKASETREE